MGVAGVVLAQSIGALVAMAIGLGAYPLLAVLRRLSLRLQAAASVAVRPAAGSRDRSADREYRRRRGFRPCGNRQGHHADRAHRSMACRMVEIAERPLLGHGYQAFWRIGNPVAEDLWRAFGIESRSGFHFHNFYLSNAVEVGVPGVAAQTGLMAALGIYTLRLALLTRDARATIIFAMSLMAVSVTPLEVPVFFPFNLQTFIVVASVVYARDGLSALRASSSPGRAGISTRA
jgi:hypothetical protein